MTSSPDCRRTQSTQSVTRKLPSGFLHSVSPDPGDAQPAKVNRVRGQRRSLLIANCFVICSSSRAIVPRSRAVRVSFLSPSKGESS